ncbi:MAG: alpha amylase C-terminal domain-containing protein [Eubacteriales bacterium]|nr:alpha amylase C-terminal domain-containing protein [Eubacteriales bacterium]
MPKHSFIRVNKLPDVCGRVDYISNQKRQEHLYAVYSTVEPVFWQRLSEQSQFDFRRSNQPEGKCTEARELIIALPASMQQHDPNLLLKLFVETFQLKYGIHDAFYRYICELNDVYLKHPALYERDYREDGFEWLDCHQEQRCIYAIQRSAADEKIIALFHFGEKTQEGFALNIGAAHSMHILIHSDWDKYGGQTKEGTEAVAVKDNLLVCDLPPFSGMMFKIG